ncbi:hypothetical protein Egran_06167 [Elaphomyces granulatus]|uniref:tRNA (adenine(58)-N(1))-methyltransferase non-catalytic subunit TRM6 n=1 Tax=Elaphomyces granulatus TaxID=519963 RepID=A0A232LPJ0_9EURO|nr:hypothetical protein Egran_06167 [Elaphomyces granulatus]
MYSFIRPNQYVVLRLQSDALKVVLLAPNTNIPLGKYGSFPANQIIGRPFYLTFEILDRPDEIKDGHVLRIVPATELHTESLITEGSEEVDGMIEDTDLTEDGDVPIRSHPETGDDTPCQKLTLAEIETLKKQATGAGKEIIAKLLESHTALGQKTAFSLAKYTLRKRKKFLRRFTVLPMDVSLLTEWILEEKDAPRILELRDELVGLIGCWGNVHHCGRTTMEEAVDSKPNGRYLIVDDTGGFVVAAMAERMGLLFPDEEDDNVQADPDGQLSSSPREDGPAMDEDEYNPASQVEPPPNGKEPTRRRLRLKPMSASENTLTLIHAHPQPNLSMLKYFSFNPDRPTNAHPLHTHLKSLSWLQLVDPSADSIYANEPPSVPDSVLSSWKPGKRSMYFRKRNRWQRVRGVVDETRAGGFDGLIVASLMEPTTILKHTVPLLAGSASVVVYSPTIDPLVELVDFYSTARRTAYIATKREWEEQQSHQSPVEARASQAERELLFPVDPTLLLGPSLQTSRVRPWQVLPGRTHPLMTGRGGAEGYVFHATRVLPSSDRITARGNSTRKRRKINETDTGPGTGTSTPVG